MSKTLTTLTLAVVAAAGLAATAEAGGRHHRHHHHHGFHAYRYVHVYTPPVYVSRVYAPSCGYAYGKWQQTGSSYWKHRYYDCKGW